jgi:hypothetical protein
MQRPTQNGSSQTTLELMVLLCVSGVSALTVLALLGPKPTAGPSEPDAEDETDEG